MKKMHLILTVMLAVFLAGCGPRSSPVADENEAVVRSYKLIDAGRAQEAIDLLEPLFKNNPRKLTLQVALASAYAAKGGLRISRFYDLVLNLLNEQIQPSKELEIELSRRLREAKLPTDLQEDGRAIIQSILMTADLVKKFNQLPQITSREVVSLRQALSILSEVPFTERGVVLYRAVLSTIELRFQVESEFIPQNFDRQRAGCRLVLSRFGGDFKSITTKARHLIFDLATLYPDTFKYGIEFSNRLDEAATALNEVIERNQIDEDVQWPCAN